MIIIVKILTCSNFYNNIFYNNLQSVHESKTSTHSFTSIAKRLAARNSPSNRNIPDLSLTRDQPSQTASAAQTRNDNGYLFGRGEDLRATTQKTNSFLKSSYPKKIQNLNSFAV